MPCLTFEGSWAKRPLKLGYGWVITSHSLMWVLLLVNALILTTVYLASVKACNCGMVCWCPMSLRWRHNGRDCVSNHQPHNCLLNRYSGADQSKHQSSASLAFVWGIHRGPVNSPHKWPVTRKIWWRHHVNRCNWEVFKVIACASLLREHLTHPMTT